jgi:hypothetical protein
MVAGLLIVPLVSAFTKAPDKEMVADAFGSYERGNRPCQAGFGGITAA